MRLPVPRALALALATTLFVRNVAAVLVATLVCVVKTVLKDCDYCGASGHWFVECEKHAMLKKSKISHVQVKKISVNCSVK